MNERTLALSVLKEVMMERHSLTEALKEIKNHPQKSFIQALCYGVCRERYRLDAFLQLILTKSLKNKDKDIYCILLLGLYQLAYMRVADYAAINETVRLVPNSKKWAKSLVNAVLRTFSREKETLQAEIVSNPEAYYSHPLWMMNKIKKEYPDDFLKICTANNQEAPLALRVNLKRLSREAYLNKITLPYEIIPETRAGFILKNPIEVSEIPHFLEGEVSVQDGAAQLASELLSLEPSHYVLDACAAPGGKTASILEQYPGIEVIALDKDTKRVKLIQENLARLQLKAVCKAESAENTARWWDGRLFDRILLDAPCSASGVIRRHPDIKLLRSESDIATLAATQTQLLSGLWPLLKPGGLLLYATCSIFAEENMNVIDAFLQKTQGAKEDPILNQWGIPCTRGRQILPGMHKMDGFYFARLIKLS